MRKRLHPMDIVVHEGALWVANSAHYQDDQGRQLVNLSRYKALGYKKRVPYWQCRIVTGAEERKYIQLECGLRFYPQK